MKRLLCFLCLLWLVPLAQAQSSFTLAQVFEKMDDVSKTFRSSQADLERTHVTIIVDDKDVTSGKFYYVRRGSEPRVKIEFTKPTAQYLLIDKGKLQLYTPNLKQVQQGSLGEHSGAVEQFMALGFGQSSQELKKNYDVTLSADEVLDGRKMTVLDLKPKGSGMGLKGVRMWMDQQKWISVQIKATEGSNDYGIYKFTNVKVNGTIPESVFDLKLPKDVRVLKM